MKARTMCQGTTLVVLQAAQVLFMDNTRPLSIVILSGAACRGPQRQVFVAGVNWGPAQWGKRSEGPASVFQSSKHDFSRTNRVHPSLTCHPERSSLGPRAVG